MYILNKPRRDSGVGGGDYTKPVVIVINGIILVIFPKVGAFLKNRNIEWGRGVELRQIAVVGASAAGRRSFVARHVSSVLFGVAEVIARRVRWPTLLLLAIACGRRHLGSRNSPPFHIPEPSVAQTGLEYLKKNTTMFT